MPFKLSRPTSIIAASSLVLVIAGSTAAMATTGGDDSQQVTSQQVMLTPQKPMVDRLGIPTQGEDIYAAARAAGAQKAHELGGGSFAAGSRVTVTPAPGVTVVGDEVRTDKATSAKNKRTLSKQFGDGHGGYKYGDPLPCGPNVNFTPFWWGMQFHLSPKAAQDLVNVLEKTQKLSDIVAFLNSIGVVVAPAVATVIATVLKVVGAVVEDVKSKITENGLIINSLWLPIPWAAKADKPFVPAGGDTPAPTPTTTPTDTPMPTATATTTEPTDIPTQSPTATTTETPEPTTTSEPTSPTEPTDIPTQSPTETRSAA